VVRQPGSRSAVALGGVEAVSFREQPEAVDEISRGAGVGDVARVAQRDPVTGRDRDVEQRAGRCRQIEVDERRSPARAGHDVLQTQVRVANQIALCPNGKPARGPAYPRRKPETSGNPMQFALQERDTDQKVFVCRPVRERGHRDLAVEEIQYLAAVFVQAAKPWGAGKTHFVQVGQEETDLSSGGTARSAHGVVDANYRPGVVDSACQWFSPASIPSTLPHYMRTGVPGLAIFRVRSATG
jgi:hypothetical protein